MKIFISGLYSGPNPSPGVGVARSLRAAYPDAFLVGVDYSPRSTGIHWPDFDDVWVARPWNQLDLDEHRRQIEAELAGGAYWISGLDLEVRWLASAIPGQASILGPTRASLEAVRKPPLLPIELGLLTPQYMPLDESDAALDRFCRAHDWRVWVKGAYYEARSVRSWKQFQAARNELAQTWGADAELFVQAHVSGREGSIVLCAKNGALVAAGEMMKSEVTPEGKTWAGRVTAPPPEIEAPLREYVRSIGWHGGAEAEFIQDHSGGKWIIEWNPRFPAWIHGATLGGLNLPGALIEALCGELRQPAPRSALIEFARVVLEVRTRAGVPLAEPRIEGSSIFAAGKHPSGMPDLARRLRPSSPQRQHRRRPTATDFELGDVARLVTPARLFMPGTAARSIERAADLTRSASSSRVKLAVALSIKTDPRPEILELACEAGLLAEAISQLEARSAIDAGFPAARLILNGPGKWWPTIYVSGPVQAVFFDSVEESDRYPGAGGMANKSNHVGPRLRLPSTVSRFGIPLESPKDLQQLIQSLRVSAIRSDLGVHFHLPSSEIGPKRWLKLVPAILDWCGVLDDLVGPVRLLDLGGGWQPDDWEADLVPVVPHLVQGAGTRLPGLRTLVLEPGKALTQRTSVLVSRVLESRQRNDGLELVADASIAELPHATAVARQVFRLAGDGWVEVGLGPDRILGRLCMEDDVLARNVDLRSLSAGDFVLFTDAGAYDRSMAYEFGHGS